MDTRASLGGHQRCTSAGVRIRTVALAALWLCAAVALPAQSRIRVVDTQNTPIPFAVVQLNGAAPRVTDSLGVVRLQAVSGAALNVRVRRLGFGPFAGPLSPQANGDYVVVLGPLIEGLDTVRTIAPRATSLSRTGFYDRLRRVDEGAIVGEFITPEELELRRPTLITAVLRGRQHITIARGLRNQAMVLGRGGRCGMTILLDGVRLNRTMEERDPTIPRSLYLERRPPREEDNSVSLDETVSAGEVMAIEIYPSAANAPAELIPLTGGGSCGIVAIWTGPRQ